MQILLVEDDEHVAALVKEVLQREKVRVTHAWTCKEALQQAESGDFDAYILDVRLPDGSGLDLLANIRGSGDTHPILMLTAASEIEDIVAGLDRGADDYLTKPFPVAVLGARIRALLRRIGTPANQQLSYANLVLDRLGREVRIGERKLKLTPTEFKLLEYLLVNRGRVIGRDELLERIWSLQFDPGTGILHANVARLRTKLAQRGLEEMIQTVRGSGYTVPQ